MVTGAQPPRSNAVRRPRGAQPRPAGGGHPPRGPAAGGGRAPARARPGCSPTASPTSSSDHGVSPVRDPGHHLHQQGRRRDEAAGRRAGRAGRREDVGVDVPLGLRAHPAAGRGPARLPVVVHDLRPGRRRPPHRLRHPRPRPRPKRFPPRCVHAAISAAKNDHCRRRRSTPSGPASIFERKIADVYREYQARLPAGRRHGLRRPAHRTVTPVPRSTPRCSSTTASGSSTSSSTSTRTPTASRTSSSLLLAQRAPQRLRRRRRRPVDLQVPRRRHAEHPRVRGGVPRRHGDRARAELPVDADDPRRRQRGHRQQPRPQAQGAVDRLRRRRADRALPRRRRGRRGAVGRPRDQPRCTTRATGGATSPSSTGPTPRAACSRSSSCGSASPTRSSAAPASTTGARSRTRWPTCRPS